MKNKKSIIKSIIFSIFIGCIAALMPFAAILAYRNEPFDEVMLGNIIFCIGAFAIGFIWSTKFWRNQQ